MPKAEKKIARSSGEVGRALNVLKPEILKHLGKEWTEDVDNLIEALDDVEKYGETRRSPGQSGGKEEDVDEDDFM